jgi:hypothetical protein
LPSAEDDSVASLDSPGATHLRIHADVDIVVARRCAQDPAVLREISLRERRNDSPESLAVDEAADAIPTT